MAFGTELHSIPLLIEAATFSIMDVGFRHPALALLVGGSRAESLIHVIGAAGLKVPMKSGDSSWLSAPTRSEAGSRSRCRGT